MQLSVLAFLCTSSQRRLARPTPTRRACIVRQYKIKKIIKFKYKIVFDKSYPDGTMNKNLDSRKIKKTNWKPKTKLNTGLAKVIKARQKLLRY